MLRHLITSAARTSSRSLFGESNASVCVSSHRAYLTNSHRVVSSLSPLISSPPLSMLRHLYTSAARTSSRSLFAESNASVCVSSSRSLFTKSNASVCVSSQRTYLTSSRGLVSPPSPPLSVLRHLSTSAARTSLYSPSILKYRFAISRAISKVLPSWLHEPYPTKEEVLAMMKEVDASMDDLVVMHKRCVPILERTVKMKKKLTVQLGKAVDMHKTCCEVIEKVAKMGCNEEMEEAVKMKKECEEQINVMILLLKRSDDYIEGIADIQKGLGEVTDRHVAMKRKLLMMYEVQL